MTMDDMTRQARLDENIPDADIETALRLQSPPAPALPRSFRARLDERLAETERITTPTSVRTYRAHAAAIAAAVGLAAIVSVALRAPTIRPNVTGPNNQVATEQPNVAGFDNRMALEQIPPVDPPDAGLGHTAERAHFFPARLLAATSTDQFTLAAPLQVEVTRLVADLRQFAKRLPGRPISIGVRATEG